MKYGDEQPRIGTLTEASYISWRQIVYTINGKVRRGVHTITVLGAMGTPINGVRMMSGAIDIADAQYGATAVYSTALIPLVARGIATNVDYVILNISTTRDLCDRFTQIVNGGSFGTFTLHIQYGMGVHLQSVGGRDELKMGLSSG
jgi:hypothetical protein